MKSMMKGLRLWFLHWRLAVIWMISIFQTTPQSQLKGWQSFATVLEAPNSNLERLDISQNNIDDEVVATFASALALTISP